MNFHKIVVKDGVGKCTKCAYKVVFRREKKTVIVSDYKIENNGDIQAVHSLSISPDGLGLEFSPSQEGSTLAEDFFNAKSSS